MSRAGRRMGLVVCSVLVLYLNWGFFNEISLAFEDSWPALVMMLVVMVVQGPMVFMAMSDALRWVEEVAPTKKPVRH